MRPFQLYLKAHWKFPQLLNMWIPCSEILKRHLIWWNNPKNVLVGCTMYYCSQMHPCRIAAHLGDLIVSCLWSDTETSLHINILELKAAFLAIKAFQAHFQNMRVLVALDNGHSSVLSQQTRGDPLFRNVSDGLASNGFLQSQSNFAEGLPHSGLSKCYSRQSFIQAQKSFKQNGHFIPKFFSR